MTRYYVTAIGQAGESVPILVTDSWSRAMAAARAQVASEAGDWSACEHLGDRWEWRCGDRWVVVERHLED